MPGKAVTVSLRPLSHGSGGVGVGVGAVVGVGVAVAGAMLRLSLAVRWGEGALIYVVSTLLGYGIIGATVLLCARAL